jgi:hypothetical protein
MQADNIPAIKKMKCLVIKVLGLVLITQMTNCKKLVTVSSPDTSITQDNVYTSDATAISVLTGVYTNMSQNGLSSGLCAMSFYPELSADELALIDYTNPIYTAYYTNSLNNRNTGISDFWNNIYPIIFTLNSAITGLADAKGMTPAVEQQLMGEAKFMRAFCYFYIVNLYGDVPLVTGTNYTINALLPRAPATEVWAQIITDLQDAQKLLSPNYLDATLLNTTNQKVRPTQWAATALLARAYLYTGNWIGADSAASAVINNSTLFALNSLDSVFLANSNEAIWQLQPVILGQNTPDAWLFIIPSTGPTIGNYPVFLNTSLLNAFEPGDQRRVVWVDSVQANGTTYYYPFKYQNAMLNAAVTEYEMVLRLAEQYLIRAEAEANGAGSGLSSAIQDLNTIRARAGLDSTAATNQQQVLAAIFHERQVELFTEWGHRWLDLKRMDSVNSVMSSVTPMKSNGTTSWQNYQQLYPITLYELQHDPNLQQNSGY